MYINSDLMVQLKGSCMNYEEINETIKEKGDYYRHNFLVM